MLLLVMRQGKNITKIQTFKNLRRFEPLLHHYTCGYIHGTATRISLLLPFSALRYIP